MNACSGFPTKPLPHISLPDHLGPRSGWLQSLLGSSSPGGAPLRLPPSPGCLSPTSPRRAGGAGGPCLRWSKLSLATGTVPSLPSCYQSAITFPLFDFFFFPRGTVRDSHNYVSSNPIPIPPACSPVGGQVGAWSPHDGLLGG